MKNSEKCRNQTFLCRECYETSLAERDRHDENAAEKRQTPRKGESGVLVSSRGRGVI